MSNQDIVPPHDLLDKITVLHKKDIQIYKPETEPGPKNNQYRDCVDLAVKIAFGLKQMQDWTELDLKQVKDWEVIKELSNNDKIDSFIIASDLPLRIKQTSDLKTVHKFNIVEKSINKVLQVVDVFSQEMRLNLKTEFCSLLNNVVDDLSLHQLACHHKICVDRLYAGLDAESSALIELMGE